ncbi:MAG: A/G-specific adenine glycosylase [Chitinivibrionales bacterium]|nr:A/G-specific adenine glycosylase [Chitinivibrionales bacterium]MBD3394673.1 A/G-specific adenine glycosylase [Chitinivibrionales bacterium]
MRHRKLGPEDRKAFRRAVYAHARRDLPWRKNVSPYRVVVSEIMLQQTRADRVAQKYPGFIRAFPSFAALAGASTAQVLAAWQGLGYNRRALMLHRCAREVRDKYRGRLPRDPEILRLLPGIGPATAASITAFAFDAPAVFIETNIRTVFIHHFFPRSKAVPDARIAPLVEQTLDRASPSRWYNALMDYGAALKRTHGNPSRRSAHHVRQKPFEGSDRHVRGRILQYALQGGPVTVARGARALSVKPARLRRILEALAREGFLQKTRDGYRVT